MKVLYIQYAGDFSEAYERLYINNGKENYYGQKYSVDAVVQQARNNINVMVLVLKTDGYRVELEKNLVAVGLNKEKTDYDLIKKEIDTFSPDRVVLRLPDVTLLKYLRKQSIPTLPVFADSFERMGLLRGRLKKYFLSKELRHKSIKWVGNHQLNAALSLKNLGINPKKILPYDWEHDDTPANWNKDIPEDICTKKLSVFFAGGISKQKGVYDLIKSIKYIKEAGRIVNVKIAGNGCNDSLDSFTKNLGVKDSVEFLGLIDHEEVLTNMNISDVVVVPSHHAYPEGLPMTIMESLMVHTPVIASNHPMFVGRLGSRGAVQFFQEQKPKYLAKKILSVCGDIERYREMCINAPYEWNELILDLKWADMINLWIDRPTDYDFTSSSLDNIFLKKNIV